ncbi:MAG: EF-hand domain-containing protein [Prochlorococcaceae cyanobacterium]
MEITTASADFASIFSLFDLDGDGSISVAEVDHLLATMAGAVAPIDRQALREFATEQGEVSITAFSLWAAERPGFAIANALREIFALVDSDNSGDLSTSELEVLLAALAPSSPSLPKLEELLAVLDRNGDGSISIGEFLQLLESDTAITLSLADLKRLKKTLLQYVSVSKRPRVALVEVDCDLGAGIPGAGSGIDMLKQAASRQQALREVSARLIEEIQGQARAAARAAEHGLETTTPHARHIEAIAAVMGDAAELVA